jgi:hypothetical protein
LSARAVARCFRCVFLAEREERTLGTRSRPVRWGDAHNVNRTYLV